MRYAMASLSVLILAAACGDNHSTGYWQDPRDDLAFEGWQQPEDQVDENPVSKDCTDACAEVDDCYSLAAEQKVNSFEFPVNLSGGKCVVACQNAFFLDAVWACLADTENKLDEDGKVVENYCSFYKNQCFAQQ